MRKYCFLGNTEANKLKKEACNHTSPVFIKSKDQKNYLISSETVSLFLPFDLLLFSTLRPLTVAIRSRKPCLFFLFLTDG